MVTGYRPSFKEVTCSVAFEQLAKKCWNHNSDQRPATEQIVQALELVSKQPNERWYLRVCHLYLHIIKVIVNKRRKGFFKKLTNIYSQNQKIFQINTIWIHLFKFRSKLRATRLVGCTNNWRRQRWLQEHQKPEIQMLFLESSLFKMPNVTVELIFSTNLQRGTRHLSSGMSHWLLIAVTLWFSGQKRNKVLAVTGSIPLVVTWKIFWIYLKNWDSPSLSIVSHLEVRVSFGTEWFGISFDI